MADRLTLVWAALMAATLASWVTGTHGGSEAVTVFVIVVAFAKVQLVGTHFMDLRHAPVPLRVAFSTWVVGVSTTLGAIYLLRG